MLLKEHGNIQVVLKTIIRCDKIKPPFRRPYRYSDSSISTWSLSYLCSVLHLGHLASTQKVPMKVTIMLTFTLHREQNFTIILMHHQL